MRTEHDHARSRQRLTTATAAAGTVTGRGTDRTIADADDLPAAGARDRRDGRRLHRHSGRARRRQHDRTFPRAEFHRGARRGGRQAQPPAEAPQRRRGGRGEPKRQPKAKPHVSRGEELGLMALLGADRRDRHLRRAEVLRQESGDLRAARRALRRPHRLLSNKYYVDELYNATVIYGTFGSADAACGRSIATSSTARSTAPAS